MIRVPDFPHLSFDRLPELPDTATATSNGSWQTPEGIEVKSGYSAIDLRAVDHLHGVPGAPPFVRGPYLIWLDPLRTSMPAIRPTWGK